MPVKRGSQHRLVAIKEVTYGTTPATPVMQEIVITRFRVNKSMGTTRSAQIRQHPFVDRMLPGRRTQDMEIGAELQLTNHDLLFEMLAGQAFSANVLKMADALIGMTLESQAQVGAGLFDLFTGVFVNRAEITFSAAEDAPIGITFGLGALTSELDGATTIASSVTAAADINPFVFQEAEITIGGVERPVSAMTVRAERTVDPLWVGGSYFPREQVPGDFTVTGSLTVPYEDDVESGRLEGFTDAPVVILCNTLGGVATSLTITLHKTKYLSMSKEVAGRGMRTQEIDYEAYYSPADATVMTITRDVTP